MTESLSIVIPVHNEAAKVGADIEAAAEFLLNRNVPGQIIIVDDASTDQTADQARQTRVPDQIPMEVISLAENRGKGCAIRTGVARSTGAFVLFADSGCCIPFDNAEQGIQQIATARCQIAVGSRRHPQTLIKQDRGFYRKLCSRLFNRLTLRMFPELNHLQDTQCGFKVYRGDVARELFALSVIDGFMFDIEILMLAHQQGYAICDFPVEWTCDRDSRLSPSRQGGSVWRDLRAIRGRVPRSDQ